MPKVSRWLRKKLNKLRGRREGPPTREQYNQQLLREAGERQAYENSRPASIASFPDSSSDSDVNNNSDQPLYRHREDRPPSSHQPGRLPPEPSAGAAKATVTTKVQLPPGPRGRDPQGPPPAVNQCTCSPEDFLLLEFEFHP